MIRYLREPSGWQAGKALFLDRDGVLNRRVIDGYITEEAELELIDVALDAARLAQSRGLQIVIVTNQGAIGRELLQEWQLLRIHATLIEQLEGQGIQIAALYACPHHPLAVKSSLRTCVCRKPAPGLLLQAQKDLAISMSHSLMIGDQPSDQMAAVAAGISDAQTLTVTEGDAPHAVEAWVATTLDGLSSN
jgi:D-glycero-D-manno-heptose 1,7-bisphosphate phosphatase